MAEKYNRKGCIIVFQELFTENKIQEIYPVKNYKTGADSHYYFEIKNNSKPSLWYYNPDTFEKPICIVSNISFEMSTSMMQTVTDKPVFHLVYLNKEMCDEQDITTSSHGGIYTSDNFIESFYEDEWFFQVFNRFLKEYSIKKLQSYSNKYGNNKR